MLYEEVEKLVNDTTALISAIQVKKAQLDAAVASAGDSAAQAKEAVLGVLANPMSTAGDIITGGASGIPQRLALGTNGWVLTAEAGAIAWKQLPAAGTTSPMTAAGDLIVGGEAGSPTRLGAGTNGYVLTLVAGSPAWQAVAVPEELVIACSDETTSITIGVAKVTFRTTVARRLISVMASLTEASAGSSAVVDINKNGVSLLSTKLSIDPGEESSFTAATPAVIGDDILPANSKVTIDLDQVGSTSPGKGLKVYFNWIRI